MSDLQTCKLNQAQIIFRVIQWELEMLGNLCPLSPSNPSTSGVTHNFIQNRDNTRNGFLLGDPSEFPLRLIRSTVGNDRYRALYILYALHG